MCVRGDVRCGGCELLCVLIGGGPVQSVHPVAGWRAVVLSVPIGVVAIPRLVGGLCGLVSMGSCGN